MNKENPQSQLIEHTLSEMYKMFKDIKEGKQPKMSASLEKLSVELKNVDATTMKEEDVKNWIKKVSSEVLNLSDEDKKE